MIIFKVLVTGGVARALKTSCGYLCTGLCSYLRPKDGSFSRVLYLWGRQFGVEDQGWLSWFAIATLTSRKITIYGNGKQVRDVLYVGDLIESFDSFLNSNLKHEVFNIGARPKNALSLLELLNMLRKLTGLNPNITFREGVSGSEMVCIRHI